MAHDGLNWPKQAETPPLTGLKLHPEQRPWPMKSSAMGVDSGVKSVSQQQQAQTVGKASIPWYDDRSLARYVTKRERQGERERERERRKTDRRQTSKQKGKQLSENKLSRQQHIQAHTYICMCRHIYIYIHKLCMYANTS